MWVVLLFGCGGGAATGASGGPFAWLHDLLFGDRDCEPHLFYAPDGSGDTYFGCEPPAGWLETPADETLYMRPPTLPEPAAAARSGEETGLPIYLGTAVTGDTGAAPAPAPEGAAPDTSDTGAWVDTADTGYVPPPSRRREPVDTADTRAYDSTGVYDTGLYDTGLVPLSDTAAVPLEGNGYDTGMVAPGGADTGLVPQEEP